MQNIYLTFEFDRIKESIDQYAKTELGREYIANLVMFDNPNAMSEALLDLSEMMSCIIRFGPFPILTSANALKLIELAKKTALLTPRDLELIAEDVLTSQQISKHLNKLSDDYSRIKLIGSTFKDLTNLEREIHRVITPSLTISDNATPELKEIRRKIKKEEMVLEQKVTSLSFTYSKYLNDDNATIRDGHFVLPVKTVEKSKVPGIIYDVSDSGATTFIEPMEIVQLNNNLTSLKVEENEEIRKILRQLTALVLLQEDEIIHNNKIIASFDFLQAKSNYAGEINGEIAMFSKEQVVDLLNARHPLINKEKVVANSYHLDNDKRILIISGPNAGGKTVSLKTVGLLVMMNQCGLAIPVNKATLGYFNNIYIDIGDNQSLSDNLSTFSAHMSHLAEIIDVVKEKDLVLLDELGTGTDPNEGEALAYSITRFLDSKKVLAMISSHFGALKELAFLSEHLENSSMIFDEEHLAPTYRFKMGAPGHSYAIDVASRYNISSKILDDAKEYLKTKDNSETNQLMEVLVKKVDEANKLQDELNRKEKQLEKQSRDLAAQELLLKQRREDLLKSVNIEKEQIIENAKKEINYIISQLSNTDLKLHEVIELKKQLDELHDKVEEVEFNEEIEVDDYVQIPSLSIEGRVSRLKGNKAHIMADNGLSFDVEVNKLHKIPKPQIIKKARKTDYDIALNTKVGIELNIIGLHVEEAMNKVIKYLDDVRLKHLSTVRIIHGFGSGALRKAVHTYLDKQKDLTYRLGGENEGGGGATVITFK